MATAFLFVSFLLAAAFFALAAGELRGIRQTVRERSDRLTAELHTVEAVLAEHRGTLDGLDNGLADLHKILDRQGEDIQAMADEDHRTAESLGKLWDFADGFENRLGEARFALNAQRERLDMALVRLDEIHGVVCAPADTAPDLDAHLSKAMEEGIMNLMQYAAGKTSGGVEVGLG